MLRPLTHIEKWQHFKRDWAKYQTSIEYKKLKAELERHGIKHPCSENILYRAYWAGAYRQPLINYENELKP